MSVRGALTVWLLLVSAFAAGAEVPVVTRLAGGPIITPGLHPSIGENIQGPSLIRMPGWVENPLGAYYLYFADHKGSYIRLAYADALTGPWRVYEPGALQLSESAFPTQPPPVPAGGLERVRRAYAEAGVDLDKLPHDPLLDLTTPHIASPDVHVDEASKRIIMYFHGLEAFGEQVTRVAVSEDGLHFRARPEVLGRSYFRVFDYQGAFYALAMPGQVYRSADGLSGFQPGPRIFGKDMRHSALLRRGDELLVFWTRVGDAPERILLSRVDLRGDWLEWQEGEPVEVLRPEEPWEGAEEPLLPSVRSVAYGAVNQLRDPAVYEEGGRTYLLYAVAGERGIAIAELELN